MPIKKQAEKALRQTKTRTVRNSGVKEQVDYLRRMIRKSMEAKDAKKALELAKSAVKAMDKAVQNKVLKANTVSRIKSRLAKALNKLA